MLCREPPGGLSGISITPATSMRKACGEGRAEALRRRLCLQDRRKHRRREREHQRDTHRNLSASSPQKRLFHLGMSAPRYRQALISLSAVRLPQQILLCLLAQFPPKFRMRDGDQPLCTFPNCCTPKFGYAIFRYNIICNISGDGHGCAGAELCFYFGNLISVRRRSHGYYSSPSARMEGSVCKIGSAAGLYP